MNRSTPTVALLLLATLSPIAGCFSGFEQGPEHKAASRPETQAARRGTKQDKKKPEQSYAEAWRVICEAEQRAGTLPSQGRTERGAHVAGWIVEHLKNKQARYWFIGFGKVKKNRRAHFLTAATKAGHPDCPLVRLLFDDPASRPASRPAPGASNP